MKDLFILLTIADDHTPVLVGLSNIAVISPYDNNSERSVISLNHSVGTEPWSRIIVVEESFEEVKKLIGFTHAKKEVNNII